MADEDVVEREFMGGHKSKIWTYLILMVLLIAIVVVINVVWKHPDGARDGVKNFFGLPGYVLALVLFLVGALIFWLGLKMETDWPEALGAFLISGSLVWGEIIVGWDKFDIGGMVVIPYVIPVVMFTVLLIYGMKKSV